MSRAMVEVTEADREAAISYLQGKGPWKREEIGLLPDDDYLVQAFAAHREAAATITGDQIKLLCQHQLRIHFSQPYADSYQVSIARLNENAWTIGVGKTPNEAFTSALNQRLSTLDIVRKNLPTRAEATASRSKSKAEKTAELLASLDL